MSLESLLRPWRGPAFRHIPCESPYDVLDFRFATSASGNRWNYPGEATLYLASGGGVALAEFARHLKVNRPDGIAPLAITRSLHRLEVSLERVLDLRDDACTAALSLGDAPHCFLDNGVARATANFIRVTTGAQAILVPSVALLDHTDRWILVVFLDKLAPDPKRFLLQAASAGTFRVSL
ncbi:MAG: RES family NAD+ phosphorylase [Chloroflexi bacterium]|nr:RES family NAD+ phosphorylase [Chloroflexota bacterium]MDA8189744.1 RES domain-containing protein [Dehalococcoidales bacterium]